MLLKKDKPVLQNFDDATQYEWLETNGLGGYSSSSIIGAHSRRYHGLLVAAIKPPTDRMVLVSKLDEAVVVNGIRTELGCNRYNGDVVDPNGHHCLSSFSKDLFPQWVYEAGEIVLKKTVAMLHEENTVLIIYDVLKSPGAFSLELMPLIAARGYHALQHAGPQLHWDVDFENGIFHNKPDGNLNIFISIPGSSYLHAPTWFNNFKYGVEEYRGLDFTEDLLNHGVLSVELNESGSLGIIISTDHPGGRDAYILFQQEKERREGLIKEQPKNGMIKQLVLTADQFIVKRNINSLASETSSTPNKNLDGATIIAGYHWFTDWGRDTMISLPGLTLSTGRHADAKKILRAFAGSVSMGMLPNRFQDNGEEPEYNTVDGTLWYFIAVYKYLQASGDDDFVLQEILPVLKDIIDWHFKGTRYNIHVDVDGLLYAGEEGQQLTWMDARIGDWVVTPRMGKPVEIQALWYNALCIYGELLKLNKEEEPAQTFLVKSEKVKTSFNQMFWYEAGKYLYDNIDENGKPSIELRPNQLFAISLPFVLIDDADKSAAILKVVEENLYTPVGLRSLPQSDQHYVGVYGGDQWHRDSSYHQGTVWSWLLGAYVDAIMKPHLNPPPKGGLLEPAKLKAQAIISDFFYHLNEGCIGSVSEIFDANAPNHPRGCVAQAWGVAEVLRVIKDYELLIENAATEMTTIDDAILI
ncbi:MAG: amylo-alpha-1,6-glucosidase [Ferruginibacter sp.]